MLANHRIKEKERFSFDSSSNSWKTRMVFLRTWYWILFTFNTAIHLNIEMISSEFFLVICSSLWIGVKLTIFFKKRFLWREHFFARLRLDSANLILIIAAHFLLSKVWLLQMITAGIAMISAITDMHLMMTNLWELGKSLVIGACIIVSWKSERGSYILPLSSVSFALTQFLRRPKSLKDFLSEVRIVCGPAFPLSVFATWLKRGEPSGSSFWLLLVSLLCSSVAAIFFRPDNSEVLVLFQLPVPSSRNRKVCHAIFMVFSLLCLTVHILLYQTFPCTYCKPVCIMVVILCVCFFFGATDTADGAYHWIGRFSGRPWPWLTIMITLQLNRCLLFCDNRILSWAGNFVKTWGNFLPAGISTRICCGELP